MQTTWLKKTRWVRTNGCYASRADNTVYGVQMDNLVHRDKRVGTMAPDDEH